MAIPKKAASTRDRSRSKTSTGAKAGKTSRAVKPQAAPPAKSNAGRSTSSKPQPEKDPKGGLTAAGRKALARKEGSHLRPGVQGPADRPEKMRRKGSFLRRHFAHPRGPMQRDGEPTRLALSAHAWGEPVPKTEADARKLAAKGHKLLEKYQRAKDSLQSAKKKPRRTA
ncbi:MAG TPA: DUF6321 domain-containing protein [Terracidiphilus sp.]|jgi:hypothetical protein